MTYWVSLPILAGVSHLVGGVSYHPVTHEGGHAVGSQRLLQASTVEGELRELQGEGAIRVPLDRPGLRDKRPGTAASAGTVPRPAGACRLAGPRSRTAKASCQ